MSQLTHSVRRSPRWAWLAACAALAAIIAFALVWIGRAGAHTSAAAVSTAVSNVATGRADAVAVDAAGAPQACTCSPTFVDMANMSETFSFGGTRSRPVLVLFQADWESFAQGAQVFIRLTIDGVVQSDTIRAAIDGSHGTAGFNFISDPLTPGTQHTATIQFRDNGVGPVFAGSRSLIVLHR